MKSHPAMRPRLGAMKEQAQGRSPTEMKLKAVSLNIGGRNTNPIEFILEGDKSDTGELVVQMNRRGQESMVDAEYGPAVMPNAERAMVNKILASIYGQFR